jgi:DNA-binding transcriptional ArsR family regulator
MRSKAALFEADLARLAKQAKAISHPARLAILDVLARRDTCVCGELVDELPLAQATVSQHLKVLKEAGLIQGEVDGPRTCYCLDRDAVAELRARLDAFLGEALDAADSSADCC